MNRRNFCPRSVPMRSATQAGRFLLLGLSLSFSVVAQAADEPPLAEAPTAEDPPAAGEKAPPPGRRKLGRRSPTEPQGDPKIRLLRWI